MSAKYMDGCTRVILLNLPTVFVFKLKSRTDFTRILYWRSLAYLKCDDFTRFAEKNALMF